MATTRASKTEVEVTTPEFNPNIAGVCKECGNGTLNNAKAPAFRELQGYDEYEDQIFLVCLCCGSHHVDVVVL